jgi:hypothetical protein
MSLGQGAESAQVEVQEELRKEEAVAQVGDTWFE